MGGEFPALLRRVWAATDPATASQRVCDALDRPTLHQRIQTVRGGYWVCSQTGQMTRDVPIGGPLADAEGEIEHYDEYYRAKLAAGVTDNERRDAERRLARIVRQAPHGRRLFEVGCGTGLLLSAAAKRGWRAEGNELSPVAAEHASKQAGVNVLVGPIESIEIEPAAYDVILCDNVFEHLSQPRRVMLKLAAALRPGGLLFLHTLSAQSLSLWVRPCAWRYYGKGHLHIPTLVSLRHYFDAAGLRPTHIETHGYHGHAPRGHSPRYLLRGAIDNLGGVVASAMRRGHRVECILRRSDA